MQARSEGGAMGSYTVTRHIPAAPTAVFRAFTEPELVADWMDSTAVVDATGPLGTAGTTYTLVVRGPWRLRTRVVRSEPGRVHETLYHGPLGAAAHMLATLRATDDGTATELVLLTEYTVPLGGLGRWIDRRWMARRPRTQANREVDRLVEIVSGRESVIPAAGATPADRSTA